RTATKVTNRKRSLTWPPWVRLVRRDRRRQPDGSVGNLEDQRGEFPWRLCADGDAVIVVSSRSYASKLECQSSIAVMKALASEPTERFFEIFKDQQGRFCWRLRLDTARVFAVSPEGSASRRNCAYETVKFANVELLVTEILRSCVNNNEYEASAPNENDSAL